MTQPKVEFALICDDVRREDSGKLMVIGLYAANMSFKTFPANTKFAILLGINSPTTDTFTFVVKLAKDGSTVLEGSGDVSFERPGLGLLPVGKINVQFMEPTEIEVKVKLGNGRFQSVRKLAIDGPPD